MKDLMPKSEALKKAVKWISWKSNEDNSKITSVLIEQAIFQFDLSPREAEFLINFYRKPERPEI